MPSSRETTAPARAPKSNRRALPRCMHGCSSEMSSTDLVCAPTSSSRPPAWCRGCRPPHNPRHALLLAPLPVETLPLMPSSTCPRLAACAAASGGLAAACAAAGGDHALLLSTLPVEVLLPLPVRCCLESRREMERTTHGWRR